VNVVNAEALAQRYPRVEFVTPLRTIEFPEEWYEANSEDHFWFQWRARAAAALIGRIGLRTGDPLRVFDIGCGTGITCRQLRRTTSWVFDGADLNIQALARCDAGMARVLYYDIVEKRPEFREQYDVIILFDVIEHIEPTRPFLEAALFHLKPGGVVLVNVPALRGLFSVYDTVAGHYRRYTLDTLAAEFASFDVSVVDRVYWGFSMVPLLWLRKQVLRGQTDANQTIRTGFVPPSPAAHALLKAGMKIETAVLKRPPIGSSAMMAIRRRS
jgi:SAM-dependent methyltransferase